MLVWGQTGGFFVYLENCKRFHIVRVSQYGELNDEYAICSDDITLGRIKTMDEGKEVLRKIAMAFRTASVECDPW